MDLLRKAQQFATAKHPANATRDGIGELVYWLTYPDDRKLRAAMIAWRLDGAPWDGKLIKIA